MHKLENVFVKHYVQNHMLAHQENIYHSSLSSLIGKSQKRDITQSIMFGIHLGHLYTLNTNCVPIIMPSSSGYPDTLCIMSLMAKCEKGHNSVKYSQNFTKS